MSTCYGSSNVEWPSVSVFIFTAVCLQWCKHQYIITRPVVMIFQRRERMKGCVNSWFFCTSKCWTVFLPDFEWICLSQNLPPCRPKGILYHLSLIKTTIWINGLALPSLHKHTVHHINNATALIIWNEKTGGKKVS